MGAQMDRNAVGWFEIYVSDMSRTKAFYEGVLAIKLDKLNDPGPGISEMWAFSGDAKNPGATGALARMEGGPSGMGGVIVYFTCEDCAVECRRVSQLGGTVKKDKFSIGQYGYIALVTDTEGNMIGLHSMS
jgi:predicted enzyme related to lactoylglutathione lyase